MPVELLKTIVNRPLPLTITDPHDIDKLRVLRAAGYVSVLLPSPEGGQRFARVLHITQEGRDAVSEFQKPGSHLVTNPAY
ncbi:MULTISPECIES: hypothetical protein [Polaromonas]|uniref:Uncharacterized protein n=1 Tax=Polaromonas aquatica TaxID=332657 RepID=A0ABW1U592_9BURK